MQVPAWLLCCASLALQPLVAGADACWVLAHARERVAADQPFAFNCTHPRITSGKPRVLWYRAASRSPVRTQAQLRVHQERTWVLFLPVDWGDAGTYHCVIRKAKKCYIIHLTLTVFQTHRCESPRRHLPNVSAEYKQVLYIGASGSLQCYLDFPESCLLDPIKWYKDCHEITRGHRFVSSGMKLYVNNVTAEDQGSYSCTARLTHTGNLYMVFNNISVSTESIHHGRRIPKIIYPKNNSIEVKLGSTLIVDCNITDVRGNSNLRCWTVNNTQVDEYYKDSKRIQEGIETNTSFQGHIFYTVNITFLEVKMEDYGLPFMCHAGVSTAYVMLTLPAPDLRTYLMAALMGLAVLVASALGVYNTFRIDLVLWYRSTFSAAKAPEDGKLYDAYVLYPKPPRASQACLDALVLQALPEVLERQCGYTLFIFGRDEIPGQAVASVIDENTRLCRRLIVILAPESPGSSLWKNMSEGQIAVYSALVQDGLKVILIELGRIEDYSAMPQSIQYIRQKHGSVRWSGDVMAPPQSARTKFWKEVRYRMPPRRFPPPPPGQPPPTHTLPSWGTEEGGRHRDGHPLTELRPPGGSPRAGRGSVS